MINWEAVQYSRYLERNGYYVTQGYSYVMYHPGAIRKTMYIPFSINNRAFKFVDYRDISIW